MPEEITILYVDDEEINLFLFESAFKRSYQVLTASSAKLGLEKLKDAYNDIIVVITDMNMPEMNGVDFIKEARKQFNKVGYFILTGYGFNQEIDQALKDKVVHKFFTKPFQPEQLKQAISEFRDIKLKSSWSYVPLRDNNCPSPKHQDQNEPTSQD